MLGSPWRFIKCCRGRRSLFREPRPQFPSSDIASVPSDLLISVLSLSVLGSRWHSEIFPPSPVLQFDLVPKSTSCFYCFRLPSPVGVAQLEILVLSSETPI
ncbi:hypothetical protein N657DRAFT_300209 [Parathielavia appendiculata]|uniref:Uncharacterized protein n=1 Tax=Parathielavia appendiculata TaxID=2587402 RepID=A0AAN6U765_9PEZI|nr:hypothetical protein N657DRAFT_300209 [Parathielavia appendiculata]